RATCCAMLPPKIRFDSSLRIAWGRRLPHEHDSIYGRLWGIMSVARQCATKTRLQIVSDYFSRPRVTLCESDPAEQIDTRWRKKNRNGAAFGGRTRRVSSPETGAD